MVVTESACVMVVTESACMMVVTESACVMVVTESESRVSSHTNISIGANVK